MEGVGKIIALLLFFIPSCIILNKKNRGFGYYVLAFFFPLIGLIFALCLKKLAPEEENAIVPNLDITEEKE